MILYTSGGPNPRIVHMAMIEKGIFDSVDRVLLNAVDGENRKEPFLSRNPMGQSPALELDDGRFLAESVTIVEYLDERFPHPTLLGHSIEDRALARMWARRATLLLAETIPSGFRHCEGAIQFEGRGPTIPEWGEASKQQARQNLAWFDRQLGSKPFITGDALTLADLMIFTFIEFANKVRQPLDPENRNLTAFMARMAKRPSATESAKMLSIDRLLKKIGLA